MDKLKANMAAAEMLGRANHTEQYGYGVSCTDGKTVMLLMCGNPATSFNLFTNPSDCQAAVIHLGEKHDVQIAADELGWVWIRYSKDSWEVWDVSNHFDTYQEAVAAAYIALNE